MNILYCIVKVLGKRIIHYYIDRYPLAGKSLLAWENEFSKILFGNFNEIKHVYRNASIVGNNRIVLVWNTKEYDEINVTTIAYDKRINAFNKK